MHRFLDSVALSGVKVTSEGYLIADAFTVRTGIQQYAGWEVGRPDLAVVNVYRPESEVFSKDTLQSFSHVPVTNDHPDEAVTSSNWKDYAVGEASTEVLRDGERMRIPLVLKDKDVIAAVKDGKRELSAGYSCDLEWRDGETADGVSYKAVQKNIRANHVAVVRRGRAGSDFRIGDSAENWGVAPIVDNHRGIPMSNLRTIMVDGLSIQTTDQGAQAIEKLQGQLRDSAAKIETLSTEHNATLTRKDAEIGELKVKLADAEKKIPDAATLDRMAAERSSLIDSATKIAKDLKCDGLTDAEIRKAAVSAAFGEDMVKDASEAEILGMFKAATKDANKPAPTDPVRVALQNKDVSSNPQDNGQTTYEKRISDAWKGTPAQA